MTRTCMFMFINVNKVGLLYDSKCKDCKASMAKTGTTQKVKVSRKGCRKSGGNISSSEAAETANAPLPTTADAPP
jgi:hypothetical protein